MYAWGNDISRAALVSNRTITTFLSTFFYAKAPLFRPPPRRHRRATMVDPSCADWPLRAQPSNIPAYIDLTNRTRRRVDVYWFDYSGTAKFMCSLAPCGQRGSTTELNTFFGHPFEFRDRYTHELLHSDHHRSVFWPLPWNLQLRLEADDAEARQARRLQLCPWNKRVPPAGVGGEGPAAAAAFLALRKRVRRPEVCVHEPVRSLYEAALWQLVRQRVPRTPQAYLDEAGRALRVDMRGEVPPMVQADIDGCVAQMRRRRRYTAEEVRKCCPTED